MVLLSGPRYAAVVVLVPANDPTLFFYERWHGAVQGHSLRQRLSTAARRYSQKCMRVSGKHTDLENVGRTRRHHSCSRCWA
ncbi:MAG: hypothetical protein IPG17_34800, partial [Sandaracinaceae bacterium]|nr:hypothetical protein [Sandaracinaceae bacterium]